IRKPRSPGRREYDHSRAEALDRHVLHLDHELARFRILAIFEIGEGPAEFDVRPRREAVANLLVGEQLILDRDFIEDRIGDLGGRFELAELRVVDVLAQLRTALEAGLALERTGFALERLDV